MPLNRDFIGRSYASDGTFEVGREHIRRFADAIGDPNPIYRDRPPPRPPDTPTSSRRRPSSPPSASPLGGRGAMADGDLGLNYALVVHGEQRFVHHRPIHPATSSQRRPSSTTSAMPAPTSS